MYSSERSAHEEGSIIGETVKLSTSIRDRDEALEGLSFCQKIRINGWFRLVVYCLACLCTSCVYYGWQAYSALLIRGGAYSWLCGPDSAAPDDADDPSICTTQSDKVAQLYSIGAGSEFLCAAVAGFLLDKFGLRLTAFVGEIVHIISFLLIIYSSASFRAYAFAMVLTGASVNIVAFPALSVMEQWPRRQAFAVSIIISCQSAASIIPPLVKIVADKHPEWSVRAIWQVWLLCVTVPVSCLYVWTLPKKRDFKALLAAKPVTLPGTAAVDTPSESGADAVGETVRLNEALEAEEQQEIEQKAGSWREFWKAVKTVDIWVVAVFFGFLMLEYAYYPAVVRSAISVAMSNFVSWLMPMQAIFGLLIGFTMDYTGTTSLMLLLVISMVIINLSCAYAPGNTVLQRFVAFWFAFTQSATFNVKYTFVNEMYDPYSFGKLVGVLGIAGGIGAYCSAPLLTISSYKTVFLGLTFLAVAMGGMTAFVFFRQLKGVSYKTNLKQTKQKLSDIEATQN